MFIGEYNHNLDDKGRLAIPIKFRADLSKGAVITKGLDNCLFLYPKEEYEKLAIKLAAMPISKANNRAFTRHLIGGAMDVELDKAGRVILPEYLRKFANIGKKVVVAGLYNRLEIWDEKVWETYRQTTEKDSNQIAEALEGIPL